MKTKMISIAFFLCTAIVCVIYIYFFRGVTQDVNFLSINRVALSNEVLTLQAENPNSSMMVSGIDRHYSDHKLYVKIRGAVANQYGPSLNETEIKIHGQYHNVEKIVLVGKNQKLKTIWKK